VQVLLNNIRATIEIMPKLIMMQKKRQKMKVPFLELKNILD